MIASNISTFIALTIGFIRLLYRHVTYIHETNFFLIPNSNDIRPLIVVQCGRERSEGKQIMIYGCDLVVLKEQKLAEEMETIIDRI